MLFGLPEKRLLDAAHIIPDANEPLGQPVVPNGLPLSKIHHAAFDAYLIGIDPDYRVHISDRLLKQHDGKMPVALNMSVSSCSPLVPWLAGVKKAHFRKRFCLPVRKCKDDR